MVQDMKRFVVMLLAALVSLLSTAQERSIMLNSQSLGEVECSGEIGADPSRNRCARLKIHFQRMTRAEVEALQIKFRSNTALIKQVVEDGAESTLILEMTAKTNTRFYVVHPELGESNEISINLAPDREYTLKAELNQSYTIVVESDVVGAVVVLDGVQRGQIADNKQLYITDVTAGKHYLELEYRGHRVGGAITVHLKSLYFNKEFNIQEAHLYKVGDYYNDGSKEGVVFWVTDNGMHGLIVSMEQSPYPLQWASSAKLQKRWFNLKSEKGAVNTFIAMSQPEDRAYLEAFRWCTNLGEDWFLPSWQQLKILLSNDDVRKAVNSTLQSRGADRLYDRGEKVRYWTSVEFGTKSDKEYAQTIYMGDCKVHFAHKQSKCYARAVAEF